jgi:hypothetical protein
MLYTMVFGSEEFEHIIGELQIATQIKFVTDEQTIAQPSELLRFRQRRRELQVQTISTILLSNFSKV